MLPLARSASGRSRNLVSVTSQATWDGCGMIQECILGQGSRLVALSKISRKNKAPLTHLSHGTPVKQPSPKCCSRTTLRFHSASRNGTDGLSHGPKAYPEKTVKSVKSR